MRLLVTPLLLAVLALPGCGPSIPEWQPKAERLTYGTAFRQLPPDPVYHRTTWVRPPETLPSRELPESDAVQLNPVYQMQIKQVPLSEASQILASTVHYTSYCASSIADRKISIQSLGTLDELADEIERMAGIYVQVDHEHKAVRFLPSRQGVEPRLYPEVSSGPVTTKVEAHGNQSTH